MNFGQEQKKEIEINSIPIINIVFLLLIFFIAAGTIRSNDIIPVDAPISETGKEITTDPIEILVSDEFIILNLELVSEEDLYYILRDLLDSDPLTEIMLKADANLKASRMIDVLKLVRKSGGQNLYLVTTGVF